MPRVVGMDNVMAMKPGARQVWDRTRAVDVQHPEVLDCFLALAIFTGAGISGAAGGGQRPSDGTFFLLLALGSLPYAMRRRAPLTVLVVASLPVLALIGLGYTSAVVGSGLFLAAYTVAALRTPRCLAAAVGWVAVLVATIAVVKPSALPPDELLTNAALFVGAFGLGRSTRVRHANSALLKERAELAERARSEAARLAVSEERLRIAQELHDVIGHSLGVIALQAQVGAHVIHADPAEAKAALAAVSSTSRTALAEIRRILGSMHDAAAEGYHPAPGLASVGDLGAEFTGAGLPVEVRTVGTPEPVPAALDVTAYRLVQEALTNVAKHAGRSRATVTVRYEPGALGLEILDEGPTDGTPTRRAYSPSTDASPGHGQLGMRERVAVWGGSLETGPRPEGGYVVRAHLPFRESR